MAVTRMWELQRDKLDESYNENMEKSNRKKAKEMKQTMLKNQFVFMPESSMESIFCVQ